MPFLLAMLVAASSVLQIHALERPRLDVMLDLEPGVGLTREDLTAMARELTDIWAPHVDLHVTGADHTLPRARETVRLIVSARTLEGHAGDGLGWIDFVDGAPLPTATLSTTALHRLIERGTWNNRPVTALAPYVRQLALRHGLARAAAHEVGHYLLRSTTHAKTGLMRATFTVDDLMDGRARAMRLEPAQVARLQQRTLLVARRELTGFPLEPSKDLER